MHRRPKKFRRTGRHTTPSQVENLAEKATKAAPAAAIAGALVTVAPQATTENASAKATTVAEQVHTDAVISRTQPAAVPTPSVRVTRCPPSRPASTAMRGLARADHANEAKISIPTTSTWPRR